MSFRELENWRIWLMAMALSVEVYRELPGLKGFGFCDQITLSCLSVPSNFAEGYERQTNKELMRLLHS